MIIASDQWPQLWTKGFGNEKFLIVSNAPSASQSTWQNSISDDHLPVKCYLSHWDSFLIILDSFRLSCDAVKCVATCHHSLMVYACRKLLHMTIMRRARAILTDISVFWCRICSLFGDAVHMCGLGDWSALVQIFSSHRRVLQNFIILMFLSVIFDHLLPLCTFLALIYRSFDSRSFRVVALTIWNSFHNGTIIYCRKQRILSTKRNFWNWRRNCVYSSDKYIQT